MFEIFLLDRPPALIFTKILLQYAYLHLYLSKNLYIISISAADLYFKLNIPNLRYVGFFNYKNPGWAGHHPFKNCFFCIPPLSNFLQFFYFLK